ncbi:putative ubiquitinyl hydrolase 1 [Medicago truncatula]|uniref:MATH domain protein n=1 Tax=Medicago truncatula TaxID=3880 RepID=G7I3Q3_MEDTR|nr:MATH domain and coiled-coil domain-containing protein At3g58250 [Medicago truncatula]XP_024637758.1 MATH domain and coiled-coil domain-containing protein At3g58250 [Medicago truncatula]AES60195.1 MATH domain protein [Medicago truncatula]RHN78553.1 putative ubiquitinyl hydrolase 1 [Medicago truncatula]
MDGQETSLEIFEKFTWKIENFSRLNVDKLYSEPYVLSGYPWRIALFPKGSSSAVDQLGIFLEAMKTANMSEGWKRDAKFKFAVFNQVEDNRTITKETSQEFSASEDEWGYFSFMTLAALRDPGRGFIVNDTCIVGAEIFVCKSAHEKQINQTVKMEVELPRPKPEDRGPNIETVSPVSSLVFIEPTKDPDAELVFAALGKVLYFLKTRKARDMNEQACKDLQVLWEELAKFKFDITWLESHVHYALGIKRYMEKALEAEKMKENMVVLELEMERLKVKSLAAEMNLDMERDLLKSKGFKELDLDSELGP